MVTKDLPMGLIATTQAEWTPPLRDLVACCGWPLLLSATPRRLQHGLSLHAPQCVLFWTDVRQSVAPTARLVAWLRERGNRPYRVVLARHLGADVEPLLRAAGAHSCVAVSDDVSSAVRRALEPWLELPAATPVLRRPLSGRTAAPVRQSAELTELPDSLRPP